MRKFIFLTEEGFTETPSNVDIENLQVLGIAEGMDDKEALKNLLKENEHLLDTDYEEVVAYELRDEKPYYLTIRDHR